MDELHGSVTTGRFVTLPVMDGSFYACDVQYTPTDLTDEALARRIISAAANRDLQAEAELYRRLAPRVRLYGLKHLRSPQSAADLVQDVLLMTLERLRQNTIREPERIASFVLGACRQMTIDLRRGQLRRERILNTYAEDVPLTDAAQPPALDLERLQHCLDHLSPRERTVLVMTFYDESPADQVATDLGISAANVRVIRHRGIEHLRECVDGTGRS